MTVLEALRIPGRSPQVSEQDVGPTIVTEICEFSLEQVEQAGGKCAVAMGGVYPIVRRTPGGPMAEQHDGSVRSRFSLAACSVSEALLF